MRYTVLVADVIPWGGGFQKINQTLTLARVAPQEIYHDANWDGTVRIIYTVNMLAGLRGPYNTNNAEIMRNACLRE